MTTRDFEAATAIATTFSIVGLAIFVVLLATTMAPSRERLQLWADEWECVESRRGTQLRPVLIGKVIVQQPVTTTTCFAYRRK